MLVQWIQQHQATGVLGVILAAALVIFLILRLGDRWSVKHTGHRAGESLGVIAGLAGALTVGIILLAWILLLKWSGQ